MIACLTAKDPKRHAYERPSTNQGRLSINKEPQTWKKDASANQALQAWKNEAAKLTVRGCP